MRMSLRLGVAIVLFGLLLAINAVLLVDQGFSRRSVIQATLSFLPLLVPLTIFLYRLKK